MLNNVRPTAPPITADVQPSTATETMSPYREALRNINWRLVVFCVALWWFIYSAPTEGILNPHFWSASNASNSDDF
jgi:hypothetical protein